MFVYMSVVKFFVGLFMYVSVVQLVTACLCTCQSFSLCACQSFSLCRSVYVHVSRSVRIGQFVYMSFVQLNRPICVHVSHSYCVILFVYMSVVQSVSACLCIYESFCLCRPVCVNVSRSVCVGIFVHMSVVQFVSNLFVHMLVVHFVLDCLCTCQSSSLCRPVCAHESRSVYVGLFVCMRVVRYVSTC